MFRELQRKNKELSRQECESILVKEKRGVLSVIGDGGYPYGMPMNHYYADDGNIYFHCGKQGHRIDALKSCDKVSFCVYDKGTKASDDWVLTIKSVIVFGNIEIINDMDKIIDISTEAEGRTTAIPYQFVVMKFGDFGTVESTVTINADSHGTKNAEVARITSDAEAIHLSRQWVAPWRLVPNVA